MSKINHNNTASQIKKRSLVQFMIEEDDVLLLNGKYQGYRIRELFTKGENERDYIAEYLWSLNDPSINKIIRSMLCV